MSEVLVLSEKEIHKLLTMSMAIEGVEQAYIQKASGKGVLLPLVFHEFDPGKADMDIKSGVLEESGIYGLKLVSWFGANPQKGLPALFGTTLLFDDRTGVPLALLNAGGVTGMRTGAAGAIGAQYLARTGSDTMLMVGTGEQSPYQIAAMLVAIPTIKNILLYSPHGNAGEKLPEIACKVEDILHKERGNWVYQLAIAQDLEEAASRSDIIVTATPARQPLLHREWIRPGTHISCIGADMEGKQELASELVAGARVFVDDVNQSVSVGECEIPVKSGLFSADRIVGEIGKVISGKLRGRLCDTDITIFDSTGIALQDLIVSKAVVELARQQGLGKSVEL